MHYRRAFIPGGTYFFTVVTWRRRPILHDKSNVKVLREAFACVRQRHPFEMTAAVVLPDHLHCIWTMPPDDADIATRWRLVKARFTKRCGRVGSIWQKRYWEHLIRNEQDLARHLDYIHYNPVKHGLVEHPADWPYSSFHRHVAAGRYAADWGEPPGEIDGIGRE